MANVDRPAGLSPVKHFNGAPWNQATTRMVILSTDNSIYGIGDAVIAFAGGDADGVPAVAKAAAGNLIYGVIVGFEVDGDSLELVPIPATKSRDYYVFVVTDPTVVYEVQANNAATFPTSDLNANANLVIANPSGISPFSGSELNAASTATTDSLQLKILGAVQRPGNDLSANTKLYVMVNQATLMGGTAGVE